MQTLQIEAPACAPWCTADHTRPGGWDDATETSSAKWCWVRIPAGENVDGRPVEVEVSRFADLEGGVVSILDAELEVLCDAKITPSVARALAAALLRGADLAECKEPSA